MRLIDADVLYKAVCRLWDKSDSEDFEKGVFEIIKNAPTIDVPTWIPCSERLPTEEEQDIDLGVLVTLGNGYKGMDFDWYHNGHWYDWGDRVIAWMPLPQPYKESEK